MKLQPQNPIQFQLSGPVLHQNGVAHCKVHNPFFGHMLQNSSFVGFTFSTLSLFTVYRM